MERSNELLPMHGGDSRAVRPTDSRLGLMRTVLSDGLTREVGMFQTLINRRSLGDLLTLDLGHGSAVCRTRYTSTVGFEKAESVAEMIKYALLVLFTSARVLVLILAGFHSIHGRHWSISRHTFERLYPIICAFEDDI